MADHHRYGHPRQSAFGRRHVSATATVSYSTSQQHTGQQPQQPQQPAPPLGNTAVRRNLFQSQLTRRPPPGRAAHDPRSLDGTGDGDDAVSLDIVVRDEDGEVALDEPPSLVVDDPDEIVLDMRQENEKERQRLADAVKHHQINQNSVPAQPEELLEAVKASLRAKVAALSEDNWMYEKEDEPRLA